MKMAQYCSWDKFVASRLTAGLILCRNDLSWLAVHKSHHFGAHSRALYMQTTFINGMKFCKGFLSLPGLPSVSLLCDLKGLELRCQIVPCGRKKTRAEKQWAEMKGEQEEWADGQARRKLNR